MPDAFDFSSVVAEDIRIEVGNKHTIIGFYSGDVIVPEFPIQIRMAALIIFNFKEAGFHEIALTFYIGSDEVATGTSMIEARVGDPSVLNVPSGMLQVAAPGDFRIEGSIDKGERLVLVRKAIRLGDPSLFPPAA
jgi:hypothetical protein